MRVAYFDCFSGISGDMALGALIHAGADRARITESLDALPVDGVSVETEEVELRGITALRVHIHAGPQSIIRTYAGVKELLDRTELPPEVIRTAHRIYRRLADASAIIHGKDPELVTFHEFGEVDCLVEILGCSMALHLLEVERVFASPVPTGMGMARTEHGIMPIPSPVVMDLLQGIPTYSRGVPVELVTAVGAAILSAVSEGYGDMPMMRADRVGYGAGQLRLDFPNAVRVVVGEELQSGARVAGAIRLADLMAGADVLIEATLDDVDAKARERVIAALLGAGATDAWIGEAVGAKGRSRAMVSALAPPNRRDGVLDALRGQGATGIRILPVLTQP